MLTLGVSSLSKLAEAEESVELYLCLNVAGSDENQPSSATFKIDPFSIECANEDGEDGEDEQEDIEGRKLRPGRGGGGGSGEGVQRVSH